MRTNLVADPSIQSGTTSNYSALNSTLSVSTSGGFYGDTSLRVTKRGQNGAGVELASPVSVIAGLPYAFSVYVRIPQTIPRSETAHLFISASWMNSVGRVISENQSAVLDTEDDGLWYRISGVWVAPPGSTLASLSVLQPLAGTDGAEFFVDAFMIEQSSYVGGFFNNISQAYKNSVAQKALTASPQVFNNLRLGADVVINNLILNTIDEYDTIWVCTDVDGWWGQTTPELPDIPRGSDDGSYDVQGRMTSRSMTLSGFFIPSGEDGALTASIDRLVQAIDLARKGGWLLLHEGPTKASWVRLAGRPEIQTVNAKGRTTFSVPLRAADPVKYHWNDADLAGFTVKRIKALPRAEGRYVNFSENPTFGRRSGFVDTPFGERPAVLGVSVEGTGTYAWSEDDSLKVLWSEGFFGVEIENVEGLHPLDNLGFDVDNGTDDGIFRVTPNISDIIESDEPGIFRKRD